MPENHALYQVGTATVDITPSLDKPVYLAGFAPNRKARSVLHPLTAGVLYVKDGEGSEICLISVDLIGFPYPQVLRVREAVADVIPSERVIICATHTHAGPDTLGLWGKTLLGFLPYRSGVDPEYMTDLVHRLAQGVRQAMKEAVPCTLHAKTLDCPGHLVRNDRKTGGSYPRGVILCARSATGIEAVLLNYAAHPEALWEKNHEISPDYPAPFRNRLKELGVETPVFFSGPLGAMLTPNVDPKADLDARKQYIEAMGHELAEVVFAQLSDMEPLAGPVRVLSHPFQVVNMNSRFVWAKRIGIFEREFDGSMISTEMAVGEIGAFRFATVPGEASPEVGHQLHDALEEGHRMILCLGLDELGYVIPSAFFVDKEYKYEPTMSVGVHMAPTIVEKVRMLRTRLNRE
jgi:hypothetical protein